MAGTLSNPSIGGAIVATLTKAASSSSINTSVTHSSAWQPTVGSSTGNVNKIYDATITIADSSTPTDTDLTSVTDPNGDSITFGVVNAIKVTNLSVTAGQDVTIGAGTNPIFAAIPCKVLAGTTPGSFTLDFGTTGLTVDSTHKILRLAVAAGTNVTAKLTVIGK